MKPKLLPKTDSDLPLWRVVGKGRNSKVKDIRGIPAYSQLHASDKAYRLYGVAARYVIPFSFNEEIN